MKLTATVYGEDVDFDHRAPDVVIEFDDVREVHRDASFFTVIKENGDQFATRIHTIKKFELTNN